ncbi:MAG: dual specificity protein phosphatase family protein [Verrucomicrobia bacterium]|nr:dual specificity protein phosphatase family protein [Verrucomicrobiota bacterium]MBS0636442.1 dual specificity protein phosphatase family protein [Verrucomicrobiota bacterium]
MYKWLLYQTTLAYGYIRNALFPKSWPVYNRITESLYLGSLPMKSRKDHITLKNEGIDTIISVVERFENHTSTLLGAPVRPEEWRALGIQQFQIETEDFKPLSVESFTKAIQSIDQGKKVYVHCKAGRGRSAAVVVAYLVLNYPEKYPTVESAVEYVRTCRPHITLSKDKIESISSFLLVKYAKS